MKTNEDGYIYCINSETGKMRYMAPGFVANKENMKWGGWKVWEAESPSPPDTNKVIATFLDSGKQPQESEVELLEAPNEPVDYNRTNESFDKMQLENDIKELKNELILLKGENENLKARIETLGNELANKPKLKRKRKYTRKQKTT